MSERASGTSAISLGDVLLKGREPPPSKFLARQLYYPWIVIGTTCIGAFIGQLDASIVQLALPELERVFNARLSTVSWVAIAYLLAMASILPVFGRLAEIYGRKLLYLTGYVLFTVASALCGLAPSLAWLIAFRVLQGIGGAMLGANSIAILVKAAGPSQHGRAMGLFAAAQAIGVSAGPAVGGLLLGFGWRWVFWASVPFGVAGAILGWVALPQTTDDGSDRHFDWRGALLLTPALTSLVVVLNEVQDWGITSGATIIGIVITALLLPLFVVQERSTAAPLVDLHLFRYPAFCGGAFAVVLSYALLYGMFFLTSFALVRGYGDSPLVAGLRLAIIPVALGATAPVSGALCDRMGPRVLTVAGMMSCILALALLVMIAQGASTDLTMVMVSLAIFGFGLGLFIAPNNDSTMHAAPANRTGEAGALVNLMRILGTSVGVVAASSVLSWRLEVIAHTGGQTIDVTGPILLAAVRDGFLMLIGLAAIAGITSLARAHHHPAARVLKELFHH